MYAVRMGGMRNSCGKCSRKIGTEDTVVISLARGKIIHQSFWTSLLRSEPSNIFSYPKGSMDMKTFGCQKSWQSRAQCNYCKITIKKICLLKSAIHVIRYMNIYRIYIIRFIYIYLSDYTLIKQAFVLYFENNWHF